MVWPTRLHRRRWRPRDRHFSPKKSSKTQGSSLLASIGPLHSLKQKIWLGNFDYQQINRVLVNPVSRIKANFENLPLEALSRSALLKVGVSEHINSSREFCLACSVWMANLTISLSFEKKAVTGSTSKTNHKIARS